MPRGRGEDLVAGNLSRAEKENLQCLEEMGFIVDDDVDESLLFSYWYHKNIYNNRGLALAILPTYACNCKCTYCYEFGLSREDYMTSTVCDKVVEWTNDVIDRYSSNALEVCFHGGEPLLNLPAIERLAFAFRKLAQAKELELTLTIVTNGTLLSSTVVDKLGELGVERALITLDGPPEIHNARRPFRDGRGTFEIVLQNMLFASEKLDVVININFDKHNYYSLPLLFDLLNGRIKKTSRRISVFIGEAKQGLTPTQHCAIYEPSCITGGGLDGRGL